jgi:hypothetical protein
VCWNFVYRRMQRIREKAASVFTTITNFVCYFIFVDQKYLASWYKMQTKDNWIFTRHCQTLASMYAAQVVCLDTVYCRAYPETLIFFFSSLEEKSRTTIKLDEFSYIYSFAVNATILFQIPHYKFRPQRVILRCYNLRIHLLNCNAHIYSHVHVLLK